ncbi:hypothetical protein MP638_001934 [Amoeboaphelidium occidentale]|nr:hypothetical protein MP638_001934 [Amoeboaphelidium occidentale]
METSPQLILLQNSIVRDERESNDAPVVTNAPQQQSNREPDYISLVDFETFTVSALMKMKNARPSYVAPLNSVSSNTSMHDPHYEEYQNKKRRLEEEECPVGCPKRKRLAEEVKKLWLSEDVKEKEVLPWFVYNIRNKGRLLKLSGPLKPYDSPHTPMMNSALMNK